LIWWATHGGRDGSRRAEWGEGGWRPRRRRRQG